MNKKDQRSGQPESVSALVHAKKRSRRLWIVGGVVILILAGAVYLAWRARESVTARQQIIAFVSSRDGDPDIYVMHGDGSGLVKLTDNLHDDSCPMWSPDGQRILFVSGEGAIGDLYLMNADGSGLVNLTNQPGDYRSFSWSPDSQRIVFVYASDRSTGDYGTYLIDANENRSSAPLPGVFMDSIMEVSWAPNGEHLAVVTVAGTTKILSIDGSVVAESPGAWGGDRDLSWTPHGMDLAFASKYAGQGYGIYTLSLDAHISEVKKGTLREDHLSPCWSPNGDWIAFADSHFSGNFFHSERNFEIGLWDRWERKLTNLTKHSADDYSPSWSPDSKRIAFVSERNGNPDIYVVNVSGRGLIALTDSPSDDFCPTWRP